MQSLPHQPAQLYRAPLLWSARALLVGLLLLSSGCGYFQFPGVYKLYIQQGNIVTDEMVDQLHAGMTKRQVRFVMGTPLAEDTFHANRWDYVWSLKDPRGKVEKQIFTIYFKDDQLTRFEGDYKKGAAKDNAEAAKAPQNQPAAGTEAEADAAQL